MNITKPDALVAYDIPLRRNLMFRLILPVDFTTDEAKRLCGIISMLAFQPELLAHAAAVDAAQEFARTAAQNEDRQHKDNIRNPHIYWCEWPDDECTCPPGHHGGAS